MTLNIAHRGGAALFPENTLAAFRNAVALGYDGAELDVQLSRDGEVVVFHDYRLKPELCRDANGAWLIPPTPRLKDMTLAELGAFDIGRADPASRYAREHAVVQPVDGERIPTLNQVVEIAKTTAKPFRLFVELKTSFADRENSADPRELAQATLGVLRAQDYFAHSVLVGFDWAGLLHAKQLEPNVECWFTTYPQGGASAWVPGHDAVNHGGSIAQAIEAAGGDGWFPMFRDVTPETVAETRALGLKIGAWTVDGAAEMRRLIGLNLDAICTDRPDVLQRVLTEPSSEK